MVVQMKIKDENFYTVLGWMLNVLELKGNELIIFAIIFSFSQDGESEFTGSLSYMQTFANIKSQHTVIDTLNKLLEKNMICKREFLKDNVRRVAYRANMQYINLIKERELSHISPNNHTGQ